MYLDYQYLSIDNSPDDPLSSYNHLIPENEIRSYPSIGIGGAIIEYELEHYLDEAGTPEDLTLGMSAKASIGRSIPEFGADFIGTKTRFSTGFLAKPFEKLLIGGSDKLSWWHRRGRSEYINHRSELLLYLKLAEAQTLAARIMADFAWHQNSSYQVILGGTNGLRGYSQYRLAGNRRGLFNLEYRFYIPVTILTVRLGGVAFYDAGSVWEPSDKIRFDNVKSNVGVGIRLGLTKSSTARIVRMDIARALTEDDFYISMATGVVFNLKSIFNHD
jgi:hypothetical protein